MEELILNAITIAVVATVWIQMIVSTGNILDGFAAWVYKKITYRWPKVHFVLFQCEKCFAGQLAIWYVIVHAARSRLIPHLFDGFMMIVLSIFFARIVGGLINKYL